MLEHWNTHISQSSSGLPDRRRRRGSSRACGVGLCRGTSLSPVLKIVVVSVPVFQPGADLGGSRWKPAQTHFQAISGLESWNTHQNSECASLFQRSSRGGRPGGERRRRALGAATCGFEPHGRWESIGAAAKGWGGPAGGWHSRVFQRAVPFQAVPVCQDRVRWEGGRFEPREQHQSSRNRIPRRLRY